MSTDTRIALFLLNELVLALRANEPDTFKRWLCGGVQDLGKPAVEELLLGWLDSFLTVEEQDRLLGGNWVSVFNQTDEKNHAKSISWGEYFPTAAKIFFDWARASSHHRSPMKLIRSITALAFATSASIALVSCGTSSQNVPLSESATSSKSSTSTQSATSRQITLKNYYDSLSAKGYNVSDKSEKFYELIGAIDGEGFIIDGSSCEVYEFDLSTESGKKYLQKVKEDGILGPGSPTPETNKNLAVHCLGKSIGTNAAYEVLKGM